MPGRRLVDHLAEATHATQAIVRSGVLRPERPDRLWHAAQAVHHWGAGTAALFAMGAARFGDDPALIDERGPVSFRDLDARADAIARGLIETGVHAGDTVAILCRNHRYFFEMTGALAKLGANALYLNTGLAAPQLDVVLQRERAIVLVHDEEFDAVVGAAGVEPGCSVDEAWTDCTERTELGARRAPSTSSSRRHADGPPLGVPGTRAARSSDVRHDRAYPRARSSRAGRVGRARDRVARTHPVPTPATR